MGQEECEIENCIQENNKRNGDAKMKSSRRILSLVLALIMICSAMGVMAFAAETAYPDISAFCTKCEKQRTFRHLYCDESLNRVIECPNHNGTHDAEEIYVGHFYECTYNPTHKLFILTDIVYNCLD